MMKSTKFIETIGYSLGMPIAIIAEKRTTHVSVRLNQTHLANFLKPFFNIFSVTLSLTPIFM